MNTLLNLAAAALIGIVICFLIAAVVILSLSNDVPRVGGIDPRKDSLIYKFRWALAVALVAALVGVVIHFFF